ncbi:clusterin-associated protein 1 homolog isoform X2 [Limulus polyphemus]|uniref:Clusterin-associated protein 1 homolog isoform X2 n=1 Tax=Limulus polyphemus TaxID=6850 RepID=A0ABM1T9F8_LIMPO|nr:clusterin-associated protein 1 homolog isoform X2 [Limulus polyphemus]
MSYRDLRNFTEMMRVLGYPRMISMENFCNPNFPLVAEILKWLVKRYDPDADLPSDIDTQQDRVIFVKSVAHFMRTKAQIRLNMKKLYMADGYSVKELLKITTLLYNAMRTKESGDDLDEDSSSNLKVSDLKRTRQLASEITTKGAALYDLLARELDLKDMRTTVVAKQLDITELEGELRNAIRNVEEKIQKINILIENVSTDETNLEAKIEKRKSDLERNQKRLQALKSVRPPFMDEYEHLEKELEKTYEEYTFKFRCLAFLDQQLEELEKAEREYSEEQDLQIKKMVEKIRQEEMWRACDPSSLEDVTNIDHLVALAKPMELQPTEVKRESAKQRVFGSMTGMGKKENLDTDSDLDLEDDDGSTDEEIKFNTKPGNKKMIPRTFLLRDSDDDF